MTSPSCPNTVSGLMSLTPGVSIGIRIMLCCPCLTDTSRKQTKCDNTGLLTPCIYHNIYTVYLNDRNGPTANAQGIKDAGIKRTNAQLTCCLPSQKRSCTSQWPVCTWDYQHLWKKKPKPATALIDAVKTTNPSTSQHPKHQEMTKLPIVTEGILGNLPGCDSLRACCWFLFRSQSLNRAPWWSDFLFSRWPEW